MTEYKDGFPPAKGWYDCKIDDIPIRLYFFICELNPRKFYWVLEDGSKLTGEKVFWKPNK